jgi:hypothetical protein
MSQRGGRNNAGASRAREGWRDAAVLAIVAGLALAGAFAIGAIFVGAPPMVSMLIGWLP